MAKRNPYFHNYEENYLFPEIARKKQELLQEQPDAKLISLGIGDTTEPIPKVILDGIRKKVDELGTVEGYTGYGSEQGEAELRELIASKLYQGRVEADEIFISDGSKPDIGRMQVLFGSQASIALQDPTYPVYKATAVGLGQKVVAMPCTQENGFFPDLDATERTDVLYFCSPNNPTGAIPSRDQLQQLVDFATANRSIIVFDSAYAGFIRDDALPKTIFEIEGARSVALETGSFSKLVGFTGVRLGWTVVPRELLFEDGSVYEDWKRVNNTFFNGACNIAQAGGIAALSDEGLAAGRTLTDFYLENARILKDALTKLGHDPLGGDHVPYLWTPFAGASSWEMFDRMLRERHLVTTPGAGFGPCGEGYLRFSAFGHRADIEEAASRLLESGVVA